MTKDSPPHNDESNESENNESGHKKKDYKVGHGKPPKQTQFKKGRSGNPKGRPKGSKNKLRGNEKTLNEHVLKEANRKITVVESGQEVSMTIAQAAIRSMGIGAAKGNPQQTRLFLAMNEKASADKERELKETFQAAVEYKRGASEYLDDRKSKGLPYKVPLPHPDHIHLNWGTLEVSLRGPIELKHQKHWISMIKRMVGLEVEISVPPDWLDDLSEEERKSYEGIDHNEESKRYLAMAREIIPVDDPLYLQFAEDFRKQWVDYYYYYAPRPVTEDSAQLASTRQLMEKHESEFSYEDRTMADQIMEEGEQFKSFMREKLRELMRDDWFTRLDQKFHPLRNVELDNMRYEYERGVFNAANHGFVGEELALFQSEKFLEKFMDWNFNGRNSNANVVNP